MREPQIVWFKRDLRIQDHPPLTLAAERGPVAAIYIVEPSIIRAPDFDARHWGFLRESLRELDDSLRGRGCRLLVLKGEAVETLEFVRRETGARRLWSHEETGNHRTFERDRAVGRWAREQRVDWREIPNNGVVRRLTDRNRWHTHWEARMRAPASPPAGVDGEFPGCERVIARAYRRIPTAKEMELQSIADGEFQRGGEALAHATLASFLAERGANYSKEMSSPLTAERACSRLSPYLAYGCLSMRQVVREARARCQAIKHEGGSLPGGGKFRLGAVKSFLSRCHWHCHFIQKLERAPSIEWRNFHRGFDGMREDEVDPDRLAAWIEGQTGYPFVDACLRSLRATGWINFRMRAMLTSFAAYDLWLDWRAIRDPYARMFTDYEPGIHYSQLQMQSGVTGINSLRIYSPVKQGYDHDPDGEFVRRWVPELAGAPKDWIHEPWKAPGAERRVTRYPRPMVDHQEAVRFARQRISAVRRREGFREEAQRVYQMHGSRMNRENRGLSRKRNNDDRQGSLALGDG